MSRDDFSLKLRRRQMIKAAVLGAVGMPALVRGQESVAAKRPPSDPNLVSPTQDWDTILTTLERETLKAICDIVIPRDEGSPAASEVGVVEFIDEWVSAPFPVQQNDRNYYPFLQFLLLPPLLVQLQLHWLYFLQLSLH